MNKIKELKARFNPATDDAWLTTCGDNTYFRFLQGHNMDVEVAFAKMKDAAKWRKEFQVDKLMDTYESDDSRQMTILKGIFPSGTTGKDRAGNLVLYNHFTSVDFPGLVHQIGMDALVRHTVYQLEKMVRLGMTGCVLIMDWGLDGMGIDEKKNMREVKEWIMAMVLFVKKMSAVADPYYPEMYSTILYCRAPKMFFATWQVCKGFLAERTIQKVRILPDNVDCLPSLLALMEEASIPEELGGRSRAVLGMGGKVSDEEEFFQRMKERCELMNGALLSGTRKRAEAPSTPAPGDEKKRQRFTLKRAKEDEAVLQEKLALEMLKNQIREAKMRNFEASERGDWKFEPEWDAIEKMTDDQLLAELRQDDFDPAKALAKLRAQNQLNSGFNLAPQTKLMANMNLAGGAGATAGTGGGGFGGQGFVGGQEDKCLLM